MPIFMIPVEVTSVNGSQTYSVKAPTKEEAITILKNGGGDFVEEQLDVEGLNMDIISVDDLWIREEEK